MYSIYSVLVTKSYTFKVYGADNEGLSQIFNEDDFQQLLLESGITQMLTVCHTISLLVKYFEFPL